MTSTARTAAQRFPVLGRIEVAGHRLLVRAHAHGWVYLDEETDTGPIAFGIVELHDDRATLMLHPCPAPWCVRNSPLADQITNEVLRLVAAPTPIPLPSTRNSPGTA